MQLRKVTAYNFLSYKELNLDSPARINIFIGQNAAGKSNLLELFRTLDRMVREQLPYTSLIFDHQNETAKITLELSCSEQERKPIIDKLLAQNTYGVKATDIINTNFLKIIRYELEFGNDGIRSQRLYTSDYDTGTMMLVNYSSHGSVKSERINLEELCKELRGINSLTEKPLQTLTSGGSRPTTIFNFGGYASQLELQQLIQRFLHEIISYTPIRNASPTLPAGEDYTLDGGGTNLVRVLHTIYSKNPRRYALMMDDIAKIFPFLKQILSPLTGSNVTVSAEEEHLENPTDISFLSLGIKQVLILVTGILTAKDQSILFIEEPEIHLHAAAQRALFNLIKRESGTKQFFITTHSPIFTGYGNDIKTFLVKKVKGASQITLIEEPDQLKIIKHELGHKNTDLFGYNAVVFMEGDTEELAFPILIDALGHSLADSGVRLVNVRGSGKLKKIEEYLRYLKDSDTIPYVIADGSEEIRRRVEAFQSSNLLRDGCITIWDKEFEDCFSSDLVLRAMVEWAEEEGFVFTMSKDELDKKRSEGKLVAKILQENLFENNRRGLDKPTLGEKMASILSKEIKEGKELALPKVVKNAIESIFKAQLGKEQVKKGE